MDKNIADLDFLDNSFDAVIMIDVLEHLTDEKGIEILKKVEKLGYKKGGNLIPKRFRYTAGG